MNLSYYNPQDRYKNRLAQRMVAIGFTLAVLFVSGLLGYWIGYQQAVQKNNVELEQIKTITAERDQLLNTVTDLKAEVMTAQTLYQQLEKTYNEALPEGPAQELMTLVRRQLAEGADPSRMAYLLQAGQPPRNCSEPETKRFVVTTPAYKGADSQVSISEGSIVIKGRGESAKNEKGAPEAWFDQAKSIELEFKTKDGQMQNKSGVLPLSHSLVFEGREYRFLIEPGARSFAKVTFNSCDYAGKI